MNVAPEWFLECQREMRGSEMEWIPEGAKVTAHELAERTAAGWKLIDQKNNPSPTAAKGYGRHWIRSASVLVPVLA